MTQNELLENVRFDENGLIPVIAQDYHSKKVRMLAYMNKEALINTLETGKIHYYSRSRQTLWLKGETSGNFQYLKNISIDCDGDTLLLQIEQVNGISCHTGNSTCFYRELNSDRDNSLLQKSNDKSNNSTLEELYQTILNRKQFPKEGSYTNYLFEKGENKILKKVGEECTEAIIAAKDGETSELVFEIADLLYHLTVLLAAKELSWADIEGELDKRH